MQPEREIIFVSVSFNANIYRKMRRLHTDIVYELIGSMVMNAKQQQTSPANRKRDKFYGMACWVCHRDMHASARQQEVDESIRVNVIIIHQDWHEH